MSNYGIKRDIASYRPGLILNFGNASHSIRFDYIENHSVDDAGTEEPVVRVSIGTPDGAPSVNLRMGAIADLIIYLQRIRTEK